ASKVKLFNAVSSQLLGDSVDVSLREDHGEATQVNVVESRSVTDELRLLESQIKLKEAEAIARRVGIRQAEAEAKAKEAEAKAKETDSENLRLRIQLVEVMADLSKADIMPIGLVFTKGEVRESALSVLASRDFDPFQESFGKDPDVGTFRPFLSQGTVEVDGIETPVTILRDSGCLQTLIKKGVVEARKTDKYVVLGSLCGQGVAPLGLVRVKSSCFSGIANVACVHELPVAGVDLVLGNDLAGGQMGNVTPPPVLREKPEAAQLEDDMPGVSPLCAVTRSMSMTNDHNVTPVVDDSLSLEGLFANPIVSQDISSAVNAVTGRAALIAAQEQDDSLRLLFDPANVSGPTTRCFQSRRFCGKSGHKADFCWTRPQPNKESFGKDPDVGTFRPFLSQGTVEVDGIETPVTILRDSGCLQTLIKEGVVAARKSDKTSFWAPFGPVSRSCLCWYVSRLLVARVDLILRNDLLQQLRMIGQVFSLFNAVTGRVALIAAQEQEVSLRLLFDLVSDPANVSGPTTRYFSQ
ncbi:hypothetical protein Hamer_G010735, partial [Homarus americanus]